MSWAFSSFYPCNLEWGGGCYLLISNDLLYFSRLIVTVALGKFHFPGCSWGFSVDFLQSHFLECDV